MGAPAETGRGLRLYEAVEPGWILPRADHGVEPLAFDLEWGTLDGIVTPRVHGSECRDALIRAQETREDSPVAVSQLEGAENCKVG
jgi:hypothetical protein